MWWKKETHAWTYSICSLKKKKANGSSGQSKMWMHDILREVNQSFNLAKQS